MVRQVETSPVVGYQWRASKELGDKITVMYFDQQTGALHAVRWWKSWEAPTCGWNTQQITIQILLSWTGRLWTSPQNTV